MYDYCQDQLIVGPGGAVSLDMNAIHRGMKDYNVDPDERILFSQTVRQIARVIINAQHEEAEAERQRKK